MRWVAALVYAASFVLPIEWLDRQGLILCPLRNLSGLPCPSCGMTHAFVALARGDVAAAWHFNALAVPLFLFGILWLAGDMLGGWPRLRPRTAARMAAVFAASLLLYGAWRIAVPSARPF